MKKSSTRLAATALLAIFVIVVFCEPIPALTNPIILQQKRVRGPQIDRIKLKVVQGSSARAQAMLNREVDVIADHIRPADYELDHSLVADGVLDLADIGPLLQAGKTLSTTEGYQMSNFIFNLNPTLPNGARNPLHDINFRHALFHLMPKAEIIGSLFLWMAKQLDTMVPPLMSEWFNHYVDPHPFSDPAIHGPDCESVLILLSAGYIPVGTWPYTGWLFPNGDLMPNLTILVPYEAVWPTSYEIGNMWAEELGSIGLHVSVDSREFNQLVRTTYSHNFDIAWCCYALGRFPDYLYEFFHSGEFLNPSGTAWPALDTWLEKLKTSLNHSEKVTATKTILAMLAGGTVDNPLPYPYPPDGFYNWSLAHLPIYSRNYWAAQQPELSGAINMRGQGIDNMWTLLNINWTVDPATIGRVDPDGEAFIIWTVSENPWTMHPFNVMTAYEWEFISPVYDSLMAQNPWTGHDEPWIATSWSYAPITGDPTGAKQWIQFDLRSDVKWQDGWPFNATEAKFAWEFLKYWQIPKYWYFAQYIKNVTVISPTQVKLYMYRTSQWDIYDLAATAAMLPSRVWANNPLTGLPWSDILEILAFDPTQLWTGGPLPTYLYGTGPFIFQGPFGTPQARAILDANRNYWLTISGFQDAVAFYFWRAGDTDLSGRIYAEDLGSVGMHWGESGVPLGPPGPDVTGYLGSAPDGKVDLDDLSMVAGNFGKTITVPWP